MTWIAGSTPGNSIALERFQGSERAEHSVDGEKFSKSANYFPTVKCGTSADPLGMTAASR